MKHVACNLCGREEGKVLFHREGTAEASGDFARITTDVYGGYGRIVRCRGCGLVYTDPRPDEGGVLAAYEKMEDGDYLAEQESRAINAHLSLHVIKRHIRTGRLLDVGCSTGLLLNAARGDFQVAGVEPSLWAAGIARERFGLDVKSVPLDKAGLPEGSFDVVSMVDVIEHFSDPLAALTAAARLVRPGGLLYLVTPDIRSFSARLLRGWWWGLRPAHLYYFSRATMTAMLERAGFTVLESRSYGRIFTYGYWLSRLRNYPRLLHWMAETVIRALGIEDKPVYINTRDSMEICARRKGAER